MDNLQQPTDPQLTQPAKKSFLWLYITIAFIVIIIISGGIYFFVIKGNSDTGAVPTLKKSSGKLCSNSLYKTEYINQTREYEIQDKYDGYWLRKVISSSPGVGTGPITKYSPYFKGQFIPEYYKGKIALTIESEKKLLDEINLSGESALQGISDLNCLEYLDLSEADINNLSFLSNFKNLKALNLIPGGSKRKEISDFTQINELKDLEYLNLRWLTYQNISFLSNLKNLKYLDISTNQLKDISTLGKLKKLEVLKMNNVQYPYQDSDWEETSVKHMDLNKITKLKNLKILEMSFMPGSFDGTESIDTSFLRKLTGLRALNIQYSDFKDFSDLSALKSLERLNAAGMWPTGSSSKNAVKFTDISGIKDLENLRILELFNNKDLSDITPIKNLKNLKILNLEGTAVSDISVFWEMPALSIEELDLGNTKVDKTECKTIESRLRTLFDIRSDDEKSLDWVSVTCPWT